MEEFEALAACTASSRMRCKISLDLPSAPSAVCASEIPSLELRIATFMPRICALIRSAIAKPAASSLALFTRRPEDKRAMVVASAFCELERLRCATCEDMLVLMVEAMKLLPI